MPARFVICLFCCLTLCILAGCGDSGPETADVYGTVTLDGKPVSGALITFRPEAEEGTPSYGGTDEQGKYSLMFTRDKEGAMLGKHQVDIETHKISPSEAADIQAEGRQVTDTYVEIPKKYRQPGALTAEVNRGGNQIDFPLTSQ